MHDTTAINTVNTATCTALLLQATMASVPEASSTASKPPVYCIGCAADITNRPADRRSLQSAAALEHVVPAWKSLLEHLLNLGESDVDIDADSGGGDPAQVGRICRKCFAAYDRYQALQTSLVSNLKKAIGVVAPSILSSSPKRHRLESGASIPGTSTSMLQLQRATGSTSASPDVAVSYKFTGRYQFPQLIYIHS